MDASLDRTFAALSDPTRRALLARLEEEPGDLSVSELAEPFAMSLPAVLKHLGVLSDAGLIARAKTGRTVTCRLNAEPMEHAMAWLDRYQRFWTERLDRLAAFVEEDTCPPKQTLQPNQAPQPNRARQPNRASLSSAASKPRQKKSSPPGRTRKGS